MPVILINLPHTGESSSAPSTSPITEVHCTFDSTTVRIQRHTSSECRSSATAFKHVLTAAAPGNNVDSLTWAALDYYQFRYKHKVQQTASTTWPPMEFCYPTIGTTIATLCFDKLECGKPCVVEDTTIGKVYTRMRVVNNDETLGEETELAFTSGTVLLVG